MKKLLGRYGSEQGHWVGDGFPVRSLFSYQDLGERISPFLLLDYAGPHRFEPVGRQGALGQLVRETALLGQLCSSSWMLRSRSRTA